MKTEEAPTKKPRCHFISKIGSRCQADPQTGKDYCFFHDPDQKKKQAEARKQGGEARSRQTEPEIKLPANLADVRLQKAGDVHDLLAVTVNHLRCGQIDVRVAQALAYLASLLLRALKADQSGVAHLLSDTINEVRRGQTDLRTAKTIGNLTAIMLTALKQEAQEASMMETQAIQPAGSTRPPQPVSADALADLARRFGVQSVPTAIAANPPDAGKPHPAVINGMANANAASQSLSS
jgi:hypothetical protein